MRRCPCQSEQQSVKILWLDYLSRIATQVGGLPRPPQKNTENSHPSNPASRSQLTGDINPNSRTRSTGTVRAQSHSVRTENASQYSGLSGHSSGIGESANRNRQQHLDSSAESRRDRLTAWSIGQEPSGGTCQRNHWRKISLAGTARPGPEGIRPGCQLWIQQSVSLHSNSLPRRK